LGLLGQAPSARITLGLRTIGRPGLLRKSAVLYSNDPLLPRVALTLVASVIRPFTIDPEVLEFADLPVGEVRAKELWVKGRSGAAIECNLASLRSPPGVNVTSLGEGAVGGVRLLVSVGPFSKPARFDNERIEFDVAMPKVLFVGVPLTIEVVTIARTVPIELEFPCIARDKGATARVRLVIPEGGLMSASVTYAIRGIGNKLTPGPANEYIMVQDAGSPGEFDVVIVPNCPFALLLGEITFTISHSRTEEVALPFRAIIK
jgi:hypothetical protein